MTSFVWGAKRQKPRQRGDKRCKLTTKGYVIGSEIALMHNMGEVRFPLRHGGYGRLTGKIYALMAIAV